MVIKRQTSSLPQTHPGPSHSSNPTSSDRRARALRNCSRWNGALLQGRRTRGPQWDYATATYHVSRASSAYFSGVTPLHPPHSPPQSSLPLPSTPFNQPSPVLQHHPHQALLPSQTLQRHQAPYQQQHQQQALLDPSLQLPRNPPFPPQTAPRPSSGSNPSHNQFINPTMQLPSQHIPYGASPQSFPGLAPPSSAGPPPLPDSKLDTFSLPNAHNHPGLPPPQTLGTHSAGPPSSHFSSGSVSSSSGHGARHQNPSPGVPAMDPKPADPTSAGLVDPETRTRYRDDRTPSAPVEKRHDSNPQAELFHGDPSPNQMNYHPAFHSRDPPNLYTTLRSINSPDKLSTALPELPPGRHPDQPPQAGSVASQWSPSGSFSQSAPPGPLGSHPASLHAQAPPLSFSQPTKPGLPTIKPPSIDALPLPHAQSPRAPTRPMPHQPAFPSPQRSAYMPLPPVLPPATSNSFKTVGPYGGGPPPLTASLQQIQQQQQAKIAQQQQQKHQQHQQQLLFQQQQQQIQYAAKIPSQQAQQQFGGGAPQFVAQQGFAQELFAHGQFGNSGGGGGVGINVAAQGGMQRAESPTPHQ